MSRIFEALSRAGGESADIVRKVVGDAPLQPEEAGAGDEASSDSMMFDSAAAEAAAAQASQRVYSDLPGTPSGGTAFPSGATASEAEALTSAIHQYSVAERQQSGHSAGTAVEPAATAAIRTVVLDPHSPVLLFDDKHRKASEQYRMVRTRIVQHPLRPRVITLTSGGPGDGKTFNAINLSGVLALKDDSRILLVDGDLRRSSVAKSLGIHDTPGLADVLRGKCTLRNAIVRISKFDNLYILPAGEPEDRPSELLDSPAWPALLEIFRRRFSYTIVDAPPVAAVADYDLIQAHCDGVVVVVRQDHSDRAAFQKALQAVPPEKRIGVILNSSQDWWLAKTAGYYYYGDYEGYYYYSKDKRSSSKK